MFNHVEESLLHLINKFSSVKSVMSSLYLVLELIILSVIRLSSLDNLKKNAYIYNLDHNTKVLL